VISFTPLPLYPRGKAASALKAFKKLKTFNPFSKLRVFASQSCLEEKGFLKILLGGCRLPTLRMDTWAFFGPCLSSNFKWREEENDEEAA
jgi:hypothetical protein